ncbi:hypothetical protein FPS14_contig00024-0001 [Flavobacterium psychrophilum]|nr:hypothetical protein FPS14_contig00024-0001 [Flavobacterium psychrophilum]
MQQAPLLAAGVWSYCSGYLINDFTSSCKSYMSLINFEAVEFRFPYKDLANEAVPISLEFLNPE